jgi:hypothetical protein
MAKALDAQTIRSTIRDATPIMTDDMVLPFTPPAVDGKKIIAAFDGGRLTSDGGVARRGAAARACVSRHFPVASFIDQTIAALERPSVPK